MPPTGVVITTVDGRYMEVHLPEDIVEFELDDVSRVLRGFLEGR